MHDYPTNLIDYLLNTVQRFSNAIGLKTPTEELSYSQIFKYIDKLSSYLYFLGVKKGDRVIISAGNSAFSIIAFWSTLRLGAIASIIHPKTSDANFQYIIKDAKPSVWICLPEHKSIGAGITKIISVEGDFFSDPTFNSQSENLFVSGNSILDVDLASIIYTSGSTGEPKGVMLNHRNMLSATASIHRYLKYESNDRILCALPISFDYGLYQMIMAFSVGATLILEADFQLPLQVLKKIAKQKASIFPVVPSMVPILYGHYRRFNFDLSSVRSVTNTGAALNQKHIEMLNDIFPLANIYSMYGLTECKRCTYLPPDKIQEKPMSVGLAIPNSELWVVNESGSRLKANEIGEIVIRGAAVMQGYWNKPDKTAEKLREGLWPGEKILYTGDYGWLDEEGFLYLHGRGDEMLKSRGVKVSPLEIEAILLKIPGIKEVAVIGVEDDFLGTAISVFLITDGNVSIDELKQFFREHLSIEKIPKYLEIVSNFPKNSNGKVDKKLLRQQFIENRV